MSSRVLDKPSDLFFAIGDAILAADLGVDVGNYDDFSGVVGDATVLIEIERDGHGRRASDGRAAHDLTISLHGVVARWRAHSPLEAVNLASLLKDLATDNRWGLPGAQCDIPRNVEAVPSMFSTGESGYNAWAATFTQTIYIGQPLLDDPVISPAWRSWEIVVGTGSGLPEDFKEVFDV